MIETRILDGPLPPIPAGESRAGDGSEIIFHGRVRGEEQGSAIVALDYEHYPGMTERELRALAEETAARFPVREVTCLHRVGRVAVGEIVMRVIIRSPHRAEGFEAAVWFIAELKKRVPIWKWAVGPGGERRPCCAGDPPGPPRVRPGPAGGRRA